eukprot:evm.model.scf_735EXC.1 EVM.evm.TU.scf_735EXC.1   scf_735EXC:8158-8765(+)
MVSSRRGQGQEASGSSAQPPPFLTKTYELVEDTATNDIVSWSALGGRYVLLVDPLRGTARARDLCRFFFRIAPHGLFALQLRRVETSRICEGPPAPPFQAQQFLKLCEAAEYICECHGRTFALNGAAWSAWLTPL